MLVVEVNLATTVVMKMTFLLFLVLVSATAASPCDECRADECPTEPYELPTERRCRCDSLCTAYGDCCAGGPPLACTDPANVISRLDGLQCQRTENIFLGHYRHVHIGDRGAYWMVSACPDTWPTSSEAAAIQSNCTYGDDSLPPVSDNATGVAYRNVYCAVCNGVESAVRWGYELGCTSWLQQELAEAEYGLVLFQLTLEVIHRECLVCGYRPPPDSNTRACYPHVSSCLPSAVSSEDYQLAVEQCASGPFSPVWAKPGGRIYRNEYCAQCNYDTPTTCATLPGEIFPNVDLISLPASICAAEAEQRLGSQRRPLSILTNITTIDQPTFEGIPFSAVLDVGSDGVQIKISTISTTFTVECEEGQVYDPALQGCRPVLCAEVFEGGHKGCTFTSDDNTSCSDVLIQLTEGDDFELVNNSSVIYNNAPHNVVAILNGYPVICVNLSSNGTTTMNETVLFYSYPTAYFVLTYIGCSLSLVGVTIILLSLAFFKELRTLSTAILANLAASMLASNLLILVGGPVIEAAQNKSLCVSVSIALHFFFLAQFGWMTAMSTEILRTILRGVRLRAAPSRKSNYKTFLIYSLFGWGFPLVIVGVSMVVNFTPSTSHLVLYGRLEDGTDGLCWINHMLSAVLGFVVPIAVSLLINLIILLIISVILVRALGNQSSIHHSAPYIYVRVYCAVFFSSGATWVFGFLAIIVATDWAWYPFIVLNSVQGFMLFLAFMFTRKVGLLYLLLFSCGRVDYLSTTTSRTTSRATSNSSSTFSSTGRGTGKREKGQFEMKDAEIIDSHSP